MTFRASVYLLDWRYEVRKWRDCIYLLWISRGYEMSKFRERLIMWIVWRLPKEVVMWAYIRVVAYGTTGRYGDTEVSELTVMDALKRWDDDRRG